MITKKNHSRAVSKIVGAFLLLSLLFVQNAFADPTDHLSDNTTEDNPTVSHTTEDSSTVLHTTKNNPTVSRTIKDSPTVWLKDKALNPKYPDYRHVLGFQKGRLRGNAVLSVAVGLGGIGSTPDITKYDIHTSGSGGQSLGFSMYAGLGYEINIAGKGSTGFYLAAELMYGLFAGSNPSSTINDNNISIDATFSGSPAVNMFGLRMRIGASFQDRMSKLYAIIGFTGAFVASYDGSLNGATVHQDSTSGFAPIFGIGYARTVMKEILDIFFEFEGIPFIDTVATSSTAVSGMEYSYMFNFRAGLRLMF